jgi:hypothetical protein
MSIGQSCENLTWDVGNNPQPDRRLAADQMHQSPKRESHMTPDDLFLQTLTNLVVKRGEAAFVALISRKFAEIGIRLTRKERAAFASAIATHSEMPTIQRARRRSNAPATIVLTADDNRAFRKHLNAIMKAGARAIPKTADVQATLVLKTLTAKWPEHDRLQRRGFRGFQTRLLKRWGRALGELDMLITISREFGGQVAAAVLRPEFKTPHLAEVLIRLHARACQIASEVHLLLSAGYADGAMARCRTLHEIAVVSFFIQKHGDETAERYLAHDAIESWRAAVDFNKHARALKMTRYTKAQMVRFEVARDEVLARFTSSFDGHYGWAAHIMKKDGKPHRTFGDLEESTLPHLRPYYQFASHNVHAKSKGVLFRLGLTRESELLLAGASNVGLRTLDKTPRYSWRKSPPQWRCFTTRSKQSRR